MNAKERSLTLIDPYLKANIDEEYMLTFDISKDINTKICFMTQQYYLRYSDIYIRKGVTLGRVDCWRNRIDNGGATHIKLHPYRYSGSKKQEIEKHGTEMLK